MNEETVRFYVAEIVTAVDYLHRKRIVHRCVVLRSPESHTELTAAT
jgi:serine/threonine protein kinase